MATLPEAPSRADFPDQESFEEALGFWQARVGRIKGMVARQTQPSRRDPVRDAQGGSELPVSGST
jgi:hypothetical protein